MRTAMRGVLTSFCLAALFFLIDTTVTTAQRRAVAQPTATFSTVKNVKCLFSKVASTVWRDGDPQVQVKTTDLTIQFTSVDAQEGTAQANFASGPSDIVARQGPFSLHFLEVTSAGSLKATTIFNQESRPGRFKAVYAQHDYLRMSLPGFEGEPAVSQYFGECEVM